MTVSTREPIEEKMKKAINQITIQGRTYVIDLDIWDSIEWRKVLKEITEKAYWNYKGTIEIHLSDYVASYTKQRDRIVTTLCHLLKDGYGMSVDEQTCVVTVAQKYDYDKDGQIVAFPSGSFFEIISRFRLFVLQNKRFPFMDGEHEEIALRKWYREVDHGLVTIKSEEKILFDNLSIEFVNVPKNRRQLEKLTEKNAAIIKKDSDVDQKDEEFEETDIDPELAELLNTPIRHLPLSAKTSRFLINLGYVIFEEIPQIGSSQVLIKKHKGGLEAAHEVKQLLDNYNLTFGMSYEQIVEQIELPDEVIIDKMSSSKRRKVLPQTLQTTLDLAMLGYTFEAIALKRDLSLFTVSKHLSTLIMRGLVDVFDFVDSYTYTIISNVIQDLPKGTTSKKIKSKCPKGIKRSTIRMVMADLKRKQKIKNKP